MRRRIILWCEQKGEDNGDGSIEEGDESVQL